MSEKAEADIIILGVGTCGEDLSLRLLGAGIDVIGIEADLIGGECPYWACIPSKVMVQAAATVQEARRDACGVHREPSLLRPPPATPRRFPPEATATSGRWQSPEQRTERHDRRTW